MTAVAALLRAVNLAGHNRMQMDALQTLCGSLGLCDAQTYLQSGNVVFKAGARDLPNLPRRLEDSLERTFGFRPVVILRTLPELREAIAKNPFATRAGIDPARLLVTFLAASPSPEARTNAIKIKAGPEELRIEGREVYVYYPNGIGRSKLTTALIEKALNTRGTARNWNTVTRLAGIMAAL